MENRGESRRLHEFTAESKLFEVVQDFAGILVISGYGARALYKDIEGLKAPDSQLHEFARKMDAEYGEGSWLVVYGGDPFQPDKPDVAHIAKFFQDEYKCLLMAIQCTELLQYGGVDNFVEYVYYYETDYFSDPHPGKNPGEEAVSDKPKKTVLWGGFHPDNQGRSPEVMGQTKVDLGTRMLRLIRQNAAGQAQKGGMLAVGGGPIGAEELQWSYENGVPIHLINAEAENPQSSMFTPQYVCGTMSATKKYGPALDYYMSIEVRDKANEVAKEVLDNFEE